MHIAFFVYFSKNYKLPPLFSFFLASPTLTMMRCIRIMLYTYWTSLSENENEIESDQIWLDQDQEDYYPSRLLRQVHLPKGVLAVWQAGGC